MRVNFSHDQLFEKLSEAVHVYYIKAVEHFQGADHMKNVTCVSAHSGNGDAAVSEGLWFQSVLAQCYPATTCMSHRHEH